MDIYQQVIVKLYEITGGRESLAVDLKDLVKKLGFYGHYSSIFERLSQEGWVAEDRKADFVKITHWGIAAAKKAQPAGDEGKAEKATSANAAICENLAKEFAALIGNFAKDASEENLKKAQIKFTDLETAFNLAKNDAR